MPRRLSFATGGYVYHVLNRTVGRARIFSKSQDFAAFERVIKEAEAWMPMRLLAYCNMPSHWHMLVWPHNDGDLSEWLRWLTVTHTQRWHAHHHTAGTGPLYQGRFKSLPAQEDDHFLSVCHYIERNPLRANLVTEAETWRWGSLWHRVHETGPLLLDDGPLALPTNWVKHVAEPQTELELEALRRAERRGSPHGDEAWRRRTAKALGLKSTLTPRGRPRSEKPDAK
jgi:putative transposase